MLAPDMPLKLAVPVAVMVAPSVPVAETLKVVFTVAACSPMHSNIPARKLKYLRIMLFERFLRYDYDEK